MNLRFLVFQRHVLPLFLVFLAGPPAALGTTPPGQLSELAARTTYEVVLPKTELGTVRYEKPLPLELLAFAERNDKFWSIGTAFAIAPDTYVSAAHVLLSGIGSPMGQPQLRDSSGKTYAVERVLKFSLHEDYVVFQVKGKATSEVLTPARDISTGAIVFAVGNALGDGVVLRDGLLTSMTPEEQDGRWKWLRFSAAASPGNSGGPLLDSEGRVAGVVVAKSPGENLNYALPIARVLDGSSSAALIDTRSSFSVPILRQQTIALFKDSFALPATWSEFSRRMLATTARQFAANQHRLLEQYSDQLPPRGQSTRFLTTLDRNVGMALIRQQDDDTWGLTEPEGTEDTELADGSTLTTGALGNAGSYQLKRPAHAADASIYHDDAAFMDTLLKGLKIPRMVGPQAIRITSLGLPQRVLRYADRFDRTWQLRSWTFGYSDMHIITMSLPTPEGHAGLFRITSTSGYDDAVVSLKLLADYTHVPYRGSIAQWRNFLEESELCPPRLRTLQIVKGKDFGLRLLGLTVSIPTSLLALDDESILVMLPAYRSEGNHLRADFSGMTLSVREEDASWVGIFGQPRPQAGSERKQQERWKQMRAREGEFNGQPGHSADYKQFWTTSVLGDDSRDLLYEVVATWYEKSAALPRQIHERRDLLMGGLKFSDIEDR